MNIERQADVFKVEIERYVGQFGYWLKLALVFISNLIRSQISRYFVVQTVFEDVSYKQTALAVCLWKTVRILANL